MHLLVPMTGAAVTRWVLIEASREAQITGAAWAVAGVAAYLLSGRSRPTPGAPSQAEQHLVNATMQSPTTEP